ncbi:MAG: hypothetical protein WAR57_13810 [Candidatus Phosphoribacter sp.]
MLNLTADSGSAGVASAFLVASLRSHHHYTQWGMRSAVTVCPVIHMVLARVPSSTDGEWTSAVPTQGDHDGDVRLADEQRRDSS